MQHNLKVFDESSEKDVAKRARLKEYNELLKKMMSDSGSKEQKVSKYGSDSFSHAGKLPNNVHSIGHHGGGASKDFSESNTIKKTAPPISNANYFDETNPLNNSFGTPAIKKSVPKSTKEFDGNKTKFWNEK